MTGAILLPAAPAGFGNPGGAEVLASGEAIFPRVASSQSVTMTSGQMVVTPWTAATTGRATTVITQTAGTAAAGLTVAQIGVYSVDAAGDLTLLAATANLAGTLWTGAFTGYTSALTSPFNRIAGQRYAIGCLAVGTTPPLLAGALPAGSFAALAPLIAAFVTTATLPPFVAAGAVTGSFQMAEAAVAP